MDDSFQIEVTDTILKKIKKPAWYPKRDRLFGNLWLVRSPKLLKKVHLCGDLEYEFWHLIEFDPNIAWYCEHPLKVTVTISGKDVTVIYDFLIRFRDGKYCLREIKFSEDIAPENIADRTSLQLAALLHWATMHHVDYKVVTEKEIQENNIYLSNIKQIIPYLRTHRGTFREDLIRPLFRLLKQNKELSLRSLEEAIAPESPQALRRLVFQLLARGELWAPLDQRPLDRNLPIRRADHA